MKIKVQHIINCLTLKFSNQRDFQLFNDEVQVMKFHSK